MSHREINELVEGYIGTNSGYLNGFSYSIHDKFYYEWCDLDRDVSSYRERGLTTRGAFIEILKEAGPRDQAKIIRGVLEMMPPSKPAREERMLKRAALRPQLLALADRLENDGQVETPNISETDEAVFEALKDADFLLNARGPMNAVDRAHTALHGYIKRICSDRHVSVPGDAPLTTLFNAVREHVTEFSAASHDAEARKVFRALAAALDSLNTIRNRGTLAHPNDLLIGAPEALLYINLSRAVLAYLEAKIKKKNGSENPVS